VRKVVALLRQIEPDEPTALLVEAALEASFGGQGGARGITERFVQRFRQLPLDGPDETPSQRQTRTRLRRLGLPEATDDERLQELLTRLKEGTRTGIWYADRKRCENRLQALPREIAAQSGEREAAAAVIGKLEREKERLLAEIQRVGDRGRSRHDRIVTINGDLKTARARAEKAERRQAEFESERDRCEQALARLAEFTLDG
jgi:chromosome segregation ATPase